MSRAYPETYELLPSETARVAMIVLTIVPPILLALLFFLFYSKVLPFLRRSVVKPVGSYSLYSGKLKKERIIFRKRKSKLD